jgi:hypothetical protein
MTGRDAALVRRWVALYTRGLSAEVRDARREEIDADLWSQAQDSAGEGGVLARLVLGMPADLAWRLELRPASAPARSEPVRGFVLGPRFVAGLALIGAAGLTSALALYAALMMTVPEGQRWPTIGEPDKLLMTLLGLGSILLVSLALWGLIVLYLDELRGGAAMLGSVGGAGGVIAAIGASGASLVVPIGSSAVVWDLARVGVLSRGLAIVHALTAVMFVIPIAATLAGWLGGTGPLMLIAVPYPLTWIGVGLALLRRSSMPAQQTPGPGQS